VNEEYLIDQLDYLEEMYDCDDDRYDEFRRDFYRSAEEDLGLQGAIQLFRFIPDDWSSARDFLSEEVEE
jgi:hypothetical protein